MENIEDHVAVLESQFARLAAMRSELYDSMKMVVRIATIEEYNAYEPLITFVSIMKEKEATGRKHSILFIEDAKRLKGKTESSSQHRDNEIMRLAQGSRKFN